MKQDSLVIMAAYTKNYGLLDTDGWKSLKCIARCSKKLNRLIKQAKLKSYRTTQKYMYGFQVPRNYDEVVAFDKQNSNTKWQDATRLEMEQLSGSSPARC